MPINRTSGPLTTSSDDPWTALGNLGATVTLSGSASGVAWTSLGTIGATVTLAGNVRYVGTLAQNTAITAALADDEDTLLVLTQDGTGNRVPTWAGVTKWLTASGSAPVLKTAAGAVDLIAIWKTGGVTYGLHYGESGATGATGATGAQGVTWRGTWSSATTYSTNDLVYRSGSTYVALQGSDSANPQTPELAPAYWSAFASGAAGSGGGGSESVDNFTRADNADISVNAPFAYTVDAGTLSIASNLLATSTTTHAYARASGAVPTSVDQHCEVTIGAITINGNDNVQCGPTCRGDAGGADTKYEASVKIESGTWKIRCNKHVAGVDTSLSNISLGQTPVAGDRIKITAVGTAIKVLYNDVEKISVTDSAIDGSTVGGRHCGFHTLEATASVQIALSELRFGV